MGGLLLGVGRPVAALPVDEVLRLAFQALPPDIAVVGECDVGEDGVACRDRLHRVRVGLPVRSRRDAEEAELRIDRIQPAVLAEPHPGDVVANGLGAPALDGGLQHGQVGLSARRRERGGDVVRLVLRRDQLEDQHVLGEPALVVGHRRGDPQRVALLAQQRVAAVARAEAPDLAGLREVADVLGVIARPRHILLAGLQRGTDGVQRLDEEAVLADLVQRRLAHPGHRPHRHDDVLRVGDLDTELGIVSTERAHAERHDPQGPAPHTSAVQVLHDGAHFVRVHPIIRWAGVDFALGTDKGAGLHAGDIGRVGERQIRVRLLLVVEPDEGARLNQLCVEPLRLFVGAVGEHHPVGLREFRDLLDPGKQPFVLSRCVVQTGNGR